MKLLKLVHQSRERCSQWDEHDLGAALRLVAELPMRLSICVQKSCCIDCWNSVTKAIR
jgi:hypothetical protein